MSHFPSSPGAESPAASRADLHLHSRYSLESDLWILRKAGVGESNTDPEAAYRAARQRGMTYVTLTDHNTIDGALRLADRDDFFISEEVTTYFPDEDVKLHLLALGITEQQHRDISGLRPNLYELVAYLNSEDILYVLAHPLTRLGGELTQGHVEKMMLLFPIWEVHNGSTLERENLLARQLAEKCTREKLGLLADKHGLEPVSRGGITFTGGSDDHAGFDIASACTVTGPTVTAAAFLEEIKAGRSGGEGSHGSTHKLAHTMLSLLAHNLDAAGNGGGAAADGHGRQEQVGSISLSCWKGLGLLGLAGGNCQKWVRLVSLAMGGDGAPGLFKAIVSDKNLRQALMPLMTGAAQPGKGGGDEFHNQLFSLVNAAWAAGMRSTLAGLSEVTRFSFIDNLDKIGRLVALQTLLLPHSLAANYHSRQRHFLNRLRGEMLGGDATPAGRLPKVGLFTDTYYEVNGVTSILRRLREFCGRERQPLEIVFCGNQVDAGGGTVGFPAVTSVHLPDYGELDLSIPPVLDIIKYCEEQQFEVIHAATPGPMGLAAFMASRILQVPLVSSFHTDVPRCISRITDDKLNEELAWTYTRWFYHHSDLVFVPSVYTSRDLAGHGLDHSRMAVLYQGVDAGRFSPAFRSRKWRQLLGGGDRKIILFVGRLSKEKGIRFLVDSYRLLAERRDDIHLAVVGDGPLRGELEETLGGSATFTGWLEGEDLSSAYASADLFVFPSRVDTSGQVVLEAQASGLPAVLRPEGGACENIEPGTSGLVAVGRGPAKFAEQIEALLDDDGLRRSMSREARRSAQSRSWEKAFGDLFDTYAELVNWWRPLSAARPAQPDSAAFGGQDSSAAGLFGPPAGRLFTERRNPAAEAG